jgi:hypothetical protein
MGLNSQIAEIFLLLKTDLHDTIHVQVAGSWIGLRKAFRDLSFLRLCLTSPASVGMFNLFQFGPERTVSRLSL